MILEKQIGRGETRENYDWTATDMSIIWNKLYRWWTSNISPELTLDSIFAFSNKLTMIRCFLQSDKANIAGKIIYDPISDIVEIIEYVEAPPPEEYFGFSLEDLL